MLSLVTAAELNYRHDALTRDRDHALRVSIREHLDHRASRAAASTTHTVRSPRAVWARPIGVHHADGAHVACAAV